MIHEMNSRFKIQFSPLLYKEKLGEVYYLSSVKSAIPSWTVDFLPNLC
jgi:hypothetical protein